MKDTLKKIGIIALTLATILLPGGVADARRFIFIRGSHSVSFATWDPVFTNPGQIALSGGNLTATSLTTNLNSTRSTTSHSSGQFYFEVKTTTNTGGGTVGPGIQTSATTNAQYPGDTTTSYGLRVGTRTILHSASSYATLTINALVNDVVGFACDFTAHTVTVYINNVNAGTFSISPGTYFAAWGTLGTHPNVGVGNFGGGSGFTYAPPLGYVGW